MHGDDIEAAAVRSGQVRQVITGRRNQAFTLAGVYARKRTAESTRGSTPHLDEDDIVAVAGNQIDFAETARPVAFNHP